MRNRIRLNEGQLKDIVKESIANILNEQSRGEQWYARRKGCRIVVGNCAEELHRIILVLMKQARIVPELKNEEWFNDLKYIAMGMHNFASGRFGINAREEYDDLDFDDNDDDDDDYYDRFED